MSADPPATYMYEDKSLDPAQRLEVETSAGVFQPTSTTRLLLRAARRHLVEAWATALDLGCGCGIVALVLRRFVVPEGDVGASDVSAAAVALTRRNAALAGVDLDVRHGSLFEPWAGRRFDLIVDDVAAMAEPVARASRWYPPEVPSEAGEDGTRWIAAVLAEAPDHLTPGGRLLFPVLTLADEAKTLAVARARFRSVEMLEEEWYPLGPELAARMDLLQDLSSRGIIEIRRRGSRWTWGTKVYVASDPLEVAPAES